VEHSVVKLIHCTAAHAEVTVWNTLSLS